MARDVERKTEHMQQPNEWMVWHGRQTKGKPGKGKCKQDKDKGKGKSKSEGKGKQHGKRGKKGCHGMEGHEDKQGQEYTEWTDTSWDHADNKTDADWWSTGAQISGLIVHGSKRQDMEEAFQCQVV